jgi:hypothetical protein
MNCGAAFLGHITDSIPTFRSSIWHCDPQVQKHCYSPNIIPKSSCHKPHLLAHSGTFGATARLITIVRFTTHTPSTYHR